MSRYASMFDALEQRGEGALGAFLMLGDPDPKTSSALLDALVEGGADMIEVGIPFSDPVADGPVVQAAAERALKSGARVDDSLALIARFRNRHPSIPVGVLTYANILAARGRPRFCADLAAAGADSLLVADVPSLEARPYAQSANEAGLDLVMIAAPNSGDQALDRVAQLSSGYSYCVARAGVTGTRDRLELGEHRSLFEKLRRLGAPPPIVGFGISSGGQVRQVLEAGAAGAIVGSAIVRLVEQRRPPTDIAAFVRDLKSGTLGAGGHTAA